MGNHVAVGGISERRRSSCSSYTPRFNEVERGVYWFHLVRLSICGQNRVRSVSSTILIGSISYLHTLSSNFRRCVMCIGCFKIQKFEILANSFNLLLWLCLILTWDPTWLNSVGNHEAAGGVSSERRRSSCSSYFCADMSQLCLTKRVLLPVNCIQS